MRYLSVNYKLTFFVYNLAACIIFYLCIIKMSQYNQYSCLESVKNCQSFEKPNQHVTEAHPEVLNLEGQF